MKRFFLLFAALFALSLSQASAQDYKNAIGGRFGSANGVSFKTGLNKGAMLELVGNFRSHDHANWFRITGLYEKYNPINGAPGLNWYYGGGASIGSYKVKGYDGDFYLAANGVLGLDYKFNGAPINISLDWVPALELTPNTGFWGGDVGLGLRFTF
ncbi:hypothetical protein Pedsa_2151 [Pseudopedobacter saltans DSM 12145]|uniref:Outer membrane insertion C-signal n=1 Tax=Pseudopedobacter saltans (strain ATCC 51119 / DSM 12145 / JCM 21818 / CCUG 39354 / LMG 10337 / NBRC 100064 / NCIMB 13643) TaxID=762903 RepID=F0SB68_PSESL|nr:hypothetical protein [Pseudopedobacter saltans]ADY52703.1 hypothetical protein Pedsa_2151 [Pseudopedobacter saltans DSM 12145]